MRAVKTILCALAVLVCAVYAVLRVQKTIFTDTTPPVISFDADTVSVSVNDGDSALLAGVTATDDTDGDLSGQVYVQNISQLLDGNSAKVTYIVFDSADNMTTESRTVVYTDYQSPHFALSRQLSYKPNTQVTLMDRLTASDVIDGNLTDSIRVSSSSLSTSTEGLYEITVQVTNSMGDTATLPLTVIIQSTSALSPEIVLSDHLVYLPAGSWFDPAAYFVSVRDSAAAEPTASMEGVFVQSNVDVNQPGVYPVVYSYTNDQASSFTAILTVVIE